MLFFWFGFFHSWEELDNINNGVRWTPKKKKEKDIGKRQKKKKQNSLSFVKLPSRRTIKTKTTRKNASSIMQTLKRI
jgi:hypothetical protein